MKKIFASALALACALLMLAGCGGSPAQPTPSASGSAEPQQSQSGAGADWLTLNTGNGVLGVHLPLVEGSGYNWETALSDETVAELITSSDTEGEFSASFRGLKSGTCTITFRYARMDALAEIRVAEIRVEEDKIVEILTSSTTDMGGVKEVTTDPELLELRQNNTVANVLAGHDSMICVSETWSCENGEEHWQSMAVSRFRREGGLLLYDAEHTGESGQVTFAESYYMEPDLPGAYYCAFGEGVKMMYLFPAGEYEDRVGEQWLYWASGEDETVLSAETDEEYGNYILTTQIVSKEFGVRNEFLYFADDATRLITGMEQSAYDLGTGEKLMVTRSNVIYDAEREMSPDAALAVLDSANPCRLTVVIDPGQADEEIQRFQVGRDVLVSFYSQRAWEMFSDRDCTQPLEEINVDQDETTVYIKLGAAER